MSMPSFLQENKILKINKCKTNTFPDNRRVDGRISDTQPSNKANRTFFFRPRHLGDSLGFAYLYFATWNCRFNRWPLPRGCLEEAKQLRAANTDSQCCMLTFPMFELFKIRSAHKRSRTRNIEYRISKENRYIYIHIYT
jgi:hypothetical protein